MSQQLSADANEMATSLDWMVAWKAEKLEKVMKVFTELRHQYPGSYNLKLNALGDGAFIFERVLPLTLPQVRTAVDFEDENDDLDYQLERFKERVAALVSKDS